MNKQVNNTIKVLEETWVNLLKIWEWEFFIYTHKLEVIRGKRINFTSEEKKKGRKTKKQTTIAATTKNPTLLLGKKSKIM